MLIPGSPLTGGESPWREAGRRGFGPPPYESRGGRHLNGRPVGLAHLAGRNHVLPPIRGSVVETLDAAARESDSPARRCSKGQGGARYDLESHVLCVRGSGG